MSTAPAFKVTPAPGCEAQAQRQDDGSFVVNFHGATTKHSEAEFVQRWRPKGERAKGACDVLGLAFPRARKSPQVAEVAE